MKAIGEFQTNPK